MLENNFLVSKLIAAQFTLMTERKEKEPVEHFCEDHPTKVVKFYCRECHTTFCASCYAKKHKQHPFSDMSELAEKLKISWESKFKEIEELMNETTNQLETVEEYDTYLAKQIAESETQVIKTGEDIKQFVDHAMYELLNKLNTYKLKCSIKLDTSQRGVGESISYFTGIYRQSSGNYRQRRCLYNCSPPQMKWKEKPMN